MPDPKSPNSDDIMAVDNQPACGSPHNMRAVADGIEAMHRKNPRRVLPALRFLLTEPKK